MVRDQEAFLSGSLYEAGMCFCQRLHSEICVSCFAGNSVLLRCRVGFVCRHRLRKKDSLLWRKTTNHVSAYVVSLFIVHCTCLSRYIWGCARDLKINNKDWIHNEFLGYLWNDRSDKKFFRQFNVLPRMPSLAGSWRIPNLQVMSHAFELKRTAKQCCLYTKESQIVFSRRTRWSVVQHAFLKQHWWASRNSRD